MAVSFHIPLGRQLPHPSEPVKRPKEFACFSYDENRRWWLGDRSLKWYYPTYLGADLKKGYDKFVQHDDSVDEHLDGLLETIAAHEQATNEAIDAHIVTWRGMMTKVSTQKYTVPMVPVALANLGLPRSWPHLMTTSRKRAEPCALSSLNRMLSVVVLFN